MLLICSDSSVLTFYHGKISRPESEKRLKTFSQTAQIYSGGGLYLVRKSEQNNEDCYVLSFMGYDSAVSHFVIAKTADDNKLSLGGIHFNSLCELVAHYSTPGAHLLKHEWLVYPVPSLQQTEDQLRDILEQMHINTEQMHLSTGKRLRGGSEKRKKTEIFTYSKMKTSCESLDHTEEHIYTEIEIKTSVIEVKNA